MELGLELKLTRPADGLSTGFQLIKDRAGPLFLSRETEALFVLTAHLKGYTRGNIKIDINEDGTLIAISGEREVEETLMVGWKVVRKGVEIKGFKKVFMIPDGVILDKIHAKFDNESTLTITMPKKVKGIQGIAIEEIQENQELVKESSGNFQIVNEKAQRTEPSDQENTGETLSETPTAPVSRDDSNTADFQQVGESDKTSINEQQVVPEKQDIPPVETRAIPEGKKQDQESISEIQEVTHEEHDHQETTNRVLDNTTGIQEAEKSDQETAEAGPGEIQEEQSTSREKRCKMCIPIVAGSTILLSLVVFVFQMIRTKSQTSRRRD